MAHLRLRRPHQATVTTAATTKVEATAAISSQSTASNAFGKHNEPSSAVGLMTLPTELHLAISKYLIYPDALSLKHTNPHFYSLVDTGVTLKVEWLFERRNLHLDCPNHHKCDLGSDLRFCRGSVP